MFTFQKRRRKIEIQYLTFHRKFELGRRVAGLIGRRDGIAAPVIPSDTADVQLGASLPVNGTKSVSVNRVVTLSPGIRQKTEPADCLENCP